MGGSVDGDVGNAGGQLPSARARAEEIARSLYPHQVEGLAFLLGRRRSILADDRKEELLPVSEQAILALTRVLSGPGRTVFRVASSRDPAVSYTLEVSGADIICTCKGFEYRGNCVHARKLKEASVSGADLPEGFEKIV